MSRRGYEQRIGWIEMITPKSCPDFDTTVISSPHSVILQPYSASELQSFARYASQLTRLINFGTHLIHDFADCSLSAPETIALSLLRGTVVRADGVRQLIETGSGEQAGIVLRSMLESTLLLLFLLNDEAEFEARSVAYSFCRFKADRAEYAFAESHKDCPPSAQSKAAACIAEIDKILLRSEFDGVRSDFQAAKAAKSSKSWYSLRGGPQNLKDLADHVGCSIWYYMYKKMSLRTHASDGMDGVTLIQPDFPVTTPLRYPIEIGIVDNMACAMMIKSLRAFIKTRFPAYSTRFAYWYDLQIKKNVLANPGIAIEWVIDGDTKSGEAIEA